MLCSCCWVKGGSCDDEILLPGISPGPVKSQFPSKWTSSRLNVNLKNLGFTMIESMSAHEYCAKLKPHGL